jgi:hypothetical protein
MGPEISNYREWLEAETSGEGATAEAAFGRLIAETRRIEPEAAFVDRA